MLYLTSLQLTTRYHTWPGLTRIPDWLWLYGYLTELQLWSFTIWLWYMIWLHLTKSPTSLYLTIKYLTDFDYITTWLDYISTLLDYILLHYIWLHHIRLTNFITFHYNIIDWYLTLNISQLDYTISDFNWFHFRFKDSLRLHCILNIRLIDFNRYQTDYWL